MSVVKGKEEDTGHTYYALVSMVIVELVNVSVFTLLTVYMLIFCIHGCR